MSAPVSASSYYKQVWQEKHKNEKEPGGPPPPRGKLTEDATDLQKRRKDVNKGTLNHVWYVFICLQLVLEITIVKRWQ